MRRFLLPALILSGLFALAPGANAAPSVPANFVVENAFPGVTFTVPTKVVWLPDGRAMVAEKRGQVWLVKNGVKSAAPVVAIDNVVLDANDRGLLGLAVDPNWFANHYLYLMYTVDPDSNGTETNADAYARLVRYTVNFTDSSTVIASSRVVLFGNTWANGIVSCSPSHTIGDLNWGTDGSLLVSAGDGASFTAVDPGGQHANCFTAGRTNTYENIGAYRAQSLTSLAGKILRIDPVTGQGYPSNPFWDGNGNSIRSRVWAYGLRNPFRFTVRPGSGATDPAAGNPGAVFIGDVGWNTWEEQNVALPGGRNFGWPCKEGAPDNTSYTGGTQPAHNGCGTWGTADNPLSPTAPAAYYNHASSIPSVPPGSVGNTAVGGMFYRGTAYPPQYRQQYLCADYGSNWIKLATVDASHNITAMTTFIDAADAPVALTADPVTGDLIYVSITSGEVRRVRYTGPTGNAAPIANATANTTFGPPPLTVNFSSAGTIDPDGNPITLSWSFGDATGSTLANPSHTYTNAGTYTAVLTATDNLGAIGRDTVIVTAAAGTGFPSTVVLDNFNRANGAIGGSWADQTAGLTVNANQLAQTANDNTVVWNGATFGVNQEAWVTLSTLNPNAPEHDLMLKVQGTSWSSGHVEVKLDAGAQAVWVTTYAPSQGWVPRAGPIAAPFGTGDRFGARALADGTLEVYRNATRLAVVPLGNWPFAASGGRIGMTLVGLGNGRLDDFGGGNVVFNTNAPPVAHVTSPVNRAFYYGGQTITLDGTATDDRTPVDSLAYHWDVELHHNTHIHFGLAFDTRTASFPVEDHDDGTGVYYRLKFRVTDKGALSAMDSVEIFPEADLAPGPITVTPAAPTAADSLTYSFRIRNLGRLPANRSRWRLRAGGTLVAEGDTLVRGLDSVLVSVRRGPLAAATHTLRASVDTLGVVTETNEANNAVTRSLVVTPAVGPNRPPVAAAQGTPGSGTAPLTVNFTSTGTSDPDGDPLTYAWAFGDAGTGSGASVSHAYAAGTWTAILTVTDGRGGSDTASVVITATPPASGFPSTAVLDNFNRANGALGASWLNATGLTVNANQLAPGSSDTSPVWNAAPFGTSQEAYVTLATISASAPEHDLMLKVQGNTWDTGHIEVRWDARVGQAFVTTYAASQGWVQRGAVIPVAFAAGDRFGARALANGDVQVYRNGTLLATRSVTGWPFAANGGRLGFTFSGAAASRLDDFGGGNTSGGGPANQNPVAAAQGSPTSGAAPLAVNFTSTGSSDPDGDPLTFAWAFGDGGTGSGASVSHTYAAGSFTATLTVSDGRGGSAVATLPITATGTPPAGFPLTGVLDNFNRANGAIGSSWVDAVSGLTVNANQLAQTVADNTVVWNGATFGADQEAYVTFVTLNPGAPEHDLMLKVQGTSWSTGHIEVKYDAPAGNVWVTTYAPSQGWIGRGGPYAATFVSGDRFGARALANGTVEVYRNTTKLATASLGSWPFAAGGGRIGLTLVGLAGGRLDDFGGGTVPAAMPAAFAEPVVPEPVLPGALALSAPRPNPSRTGVTFALDLPHESNVDFRIFDLSGRELSAESATRGAGRWTLAWSGTTRDGRRAAPGIYLARVAVGGTVLSRRLVLVP